MDRLELAGAPLAWLCLFLVTCALAAPALIRGFLRRGSGAGREGGFWVQRAPQLAIGLALGVSTTAFELIELRLGTGAPAFGAQLFERLGAFEPLLSLAPFLPGAWAAALAWGGVLLAASGSLFLLGGLHALAGSFSPDAALVVGHELRRAGPFRWVMHPVYSGHCQFLVGSALVAVSPLALLLGVGLAAPLLLRRARHEERLLAEHFGSAYAELAAACRGRRLVPTWIPFGL